MIRRSAFVAGSLASGAAGLVRAPARAAQFEMSVGTHLPPDHSSTVRLVQMWEAIEKESGGRIRGKIFPNSQLGSDTAMFSQLRLGGLKFLLITPGNIATVIPVGDITYLGFAYRNAADGMRAMDGPLGGYVRQEIAAKGLVGLRAFWDAGMGQVSSIYKPVHGPDDFQGYKIRVAVSRIVVDLFKTLGASPIPLAYDEIITALQTKLVDGTSSPLETIQSSGWATTLRYTSLTNHQWTGLCMIANGETWKALPADLQAVVERNNTKYAMLQRRDMLVGNSAVADKLRRAGLNMNAVDQAPFRARLRSYYQAWSGEFGSTAWNLLQSSLGRNFT